MKNWLGKVLVALVCVVTPRCQEMTRLVSAERERPLSRITRLRMRWHYGICVWCLRYRDQLALIGRLGRSLDEGPDHRPGLSEETKAMLKETLTRHHPND